MGVGEPADPTRPNRIGLSLRRRRAVRPDARRRSARGGLLAAATAPLRARRMARMVRAQPGSDPAEGGRCARSPPRSRASVTARRRHRPRLDAGRRAVGAVLAGTPRRPRLAAARGPRPGRRPDRHPLRDRDGHRLGRPGPDHLGGIRAAGDPPAGSRLCPDQGGSGRDAGGRGDRRARARAWRPLCSSSSARSWSHPSRAGSKPCAIGSRAGVCRPRSPTRSSGWRDALARRDRLGHLGPGRLDRLPVHRPPVRRVHDLLPAPGR